jgi:hypothetical protein
MATTATVALRANTALLLGFPVQPEGVAALSLETAALTLDAEIAASTGALVTPAITTRQQTLAAAVGGRKAFDAGPLSLSLGLRAGAMAVLQRYDTRTRTAPPRTQVVPMLLTVGRLDARVGGPINVMVEVGLRASLMRTAAAGTEARLQEFGALGCGVMW